MKIALFAAVEEEVLSMKEQVHLTGIGRESATSSMLKFMQQHHNEDLIIEKNKEDFNNYMEHLKILKVKEKFNIAQRNKIKNV